MFVNVFLSHPFSVKISIKKSSSLWRYFSVEVLFAPERKPLNTPIAVCIAIFELVFVCTFVTDVFQKILKSYRYL